MHRHDHVQEILIANRSHNSRRIGGRGFQCHVRGFDDFQSFTQELHIEGDQHTASIHGGFDDGFVLAGLFGCGGDFHFAGLHLALC